MGRKAIAGGRRRGNWGTPARIREQESSITPFASDEDEQPSPYPQSIPGDWQTHLWVRPDPGETDYHRSIGYALSIDGYAYMEEVWKLDDPLDGRGQDRVATFQNERGEWHGSFADLRCCLFFVQRGLKWSEGRDADGLMDCYWRLYETLCRRWEAEATARPGTVGSVEV